MPANLTPIYFAAEKKYKEARTTEEKIAALQEMLSVIPKHKGTDHLQGDIKRRLAQLRQEGERKKTAGPKRAVSPYVIPRAGAGQVVLIGPPNAGKSAIVQALTNAPVTVAEYPFSTTTPAPGMMIFDTVRVQLIDTPPLAEGACDPELASLLRRADLALLVLSVSEPEVLDQIDLAAEELKRHHVQLVADPEGQYEVEVVGGAVKSLCGVTGMDAEGAAEVLELIRASVDLPVLPLSTVTGEGLDGFRWRLWEALEMIRIFTKQPGKKPDRAEPFFLSKGGTVKDLARKIHADIARNLKYARVWGANVHNGQQVQRDHPLSDGDVVEIHA